MSGEAEENNLALRILAERIKKEENIAKRFQENLRKEEEVRKCQEERFQSKPSPNIQTIFLKSLTGSDCRHSYTLKADEESNYRSCDCQSTLPPCPMCLSRTCPVCETWTENTLQVFYKPCECCNYDQCRERCLPKHCTILATDNYHGVSPNANSC